MKNYVIIGNSAAAVGCIEGIRSYDSESPITVISKEPHHTYSRPLISYLLLHATDEKRMMYRPETFYEDNNVRFIGGCTALSIDTSAKVVACSGQGVSSVPYDSLLIATGSDPFVPPTQGLDSVINAYTFMTLDDAHALQQVISPDSRVLIVGAGLIGLKCAEGILEMFPDSDTSPSVHVVDMAARILPSILEDEPSALVRSHLESHGVHFTLSDCVSEFQCNRAVLRSGAVLDFDVLVQCVGVRPNISLAKDAGCACDRGILIDGYGKTSLDDIYAAGDCAQGFDFSCGQSRVLAILPNAYMQGRAAGCAMTGCASSADSFDNAIPMNAIGFFGLHILSAGTYSFPDENGSSDVEEYVSASDASYRKLIFKDNMLKGFMLIGDIARAGIYTSLIRSGAVMDNIDKATLIESPALAAFSPDYRREVLSAEVGL